MTPVVRRRHQPRMGDPSVFMEPLYTVLRGSTANLVEPTVRRWCLSGWPLSQRAAPLGMITTGQGAWCATWLLTDPRASRAKPPAPRDPRTIMSAFMVPATSIRAWAGTPDTASTVTDSGWGPFNAAR